MSSPASKRRQPSAAVMAAAEAAAAAAQHAAQHAPPPEGGAGDGFGNALFGGPDDAGGANGAAAAAAAPGAAAASPVTKAKDRRDLTDAERRDRRLQQNRLAAKRSYNKRVQRQAEMEQEYEKLRAELEATNNQVSTLGNYIAKMPVFAHLTADPTWHQIMAQHPMPGANAAPQAPQPQQLQQPQYPQAQMQQQFGTAEAAAVFQQQAAGMPQAAGMAQMAPPPVPTHGAVQPGLDNGGWPATKTESLTVPVASAAQNGAGGSPPGAAGVAIAAAAGVAPMQVPGVAPQVGQAPGQIHGAGPPMVPVPSIVVNSDRVLCVATATIDLEQCLSSRPFNRWASTLDPKFRLERLTFTAAEIGEAGVTSVSMQAECTDRATGRPLSASVLLRDEAQTQKVGLLVLLEPEGGDGPYAIATRQPRLSVGIFESLEIPLAEARGDDVLFSAGPGDAAALAQEAGLNLAAGGRPIDLCALVQAEASPGGPAGKHGVWLTPGTDDTTRVFLCRQSCSQTELQMLASRLARPSESQPGRVPAPVSGVKTEGLNTSLRAPTRQLVVVPYADLRSSRDIRTLCATALYERVAPRLPPLASLADGGRGMWPRSQNKQAAAARPAQAQAAQAPPQAVQMDGAGAI